MKSQVATTAINILAASGTLMTYDMENVNFLLQFAADSTVIATCIESLPRRGEVLFENWQSQRVVGYVQDVTSSVRVRNEEELPHLYASPMFHPSSRTPGAARSTDRDAPTPQQLAEELENGMLLAVYEECARRDPRNAKGIGNCLALARLQPRPLVLGNQIRQTSVSEAGRALDWDSLHPSFETALRNFHDGPIAWASAVRMATPRPRSASPSSRPAPDYSEVALAIASELTSTLGPALTNVAEAVRCVSPDRSPAQSAENAIEMARVVGLEMARASQVNRVAELERVEDTNKVRHGDPHAPVWYDFRPAQAQDFGMTELAAALPRENDVSTALGSMGPALLTYREGRPKLHELVARALIEQLCVRSPSPNVERESQTVADMLVGALYAKMYMQKHSARLSNAERSVGAASPPGASAIVQAQAPNRSTHTMVRCRMARTALDPSGITLPSA